MRFVIALGIASLVLAACSDSEESGDTTLAPVSATTATPPATTTTEPPATTQAPVTTLPATTTTSTIPAFELPPTPVAAILDAYNEGGEGLFPSGTVEAQWYQTDGFYVVIYRGLDIRLQGPLCAGNSIQTAAGFEFISNSPAGEAGPDAVCVDVPNLATEGVRQCAGSIAYVTDIPTTAEGALFATLEFNDGSGFIGQTSSVQSDLANTPEIDFSFAAYILPPSSVEEGGLIEC